MIARSLCLMLVVTLAGVNAPALAQNASPEKLEQYVTPETIPVRVLDADASFARLTPKEKAYAHWMSMASWWGALITFDQVSAESPAILELFLRLFSKNQLALRKAVSWRGVTDAEMNALRCYAARFLSNCGNYLSFGDTKFIPRLPLARFQVIVEAAAHLGPKLDERLLARFDEVKDKIYSLEKDERALGLEQFGTSNYYGENVTKADIEAVNKFMQKKRLEAWNTRLFKQGRLLRLKIASVTGRNTIPRRIDENHTVHLQYGDYADILKRVVKAFRMAYHYAANDGQRAMIRAYIAHFESGDVKLHKDAMRHWVKDVGPVVETNIGFIETYRDPIHVRAEWEGFVSIVNKEQSKKFGVLVDNAVKYIALLPWGKAFEKDKFKRPDFTSLEVITFANSGIPAGINIPNYDEIRMNEGFKNVSLGNVLSSSSASKRRVEYVEDQDQELYKKLSNEAFEVQVGLHELLGHGSGKLLMEVKPGTFNFDRDTVNPLTGEKVASWYEPGQTWGQVFGRIASSFEECRAEGVGMFLCHDSDVLKIFGLEGEHAQDVAYVNWLLMARSGLAALAFYNPETKKWGQAHMQARYCLMQVMLRSGVAGLKKDAQGRWVISLDRAKAATTGREAMGDFLKKLNIYKAVADADAAKKMYADYSTPDARMLEVRKYGMQHRRPRHVWVQAVTDIDGRGNVVLRAYPASYQGVIDSFVDRYDFLIKE